MSTRCNIEFYNDPSANGDVFAEFGDPEARIYQHGDGYPEGKFGILANLKQLEKRLAGKDVSLKSLPHPYDKNKTAFDYQKIYGTRLDDPEWAAAEYLTMFRMPMGGSLYVSQQNHGDIDFLYRVVCRPDGLVVRVFVPEYDEKYEITSYRELKPEELEARKQEERARSSRRVRNARLRRVRKFAKSA